MQEDDSKLTATIPLRTTEKMAADLADAANGVARRPALVRIFIQEGLDRREAAKLAKITPAEADAVVAARARGIDPIAALTEACQQKLESEAGAPM
jgi:hypothetical protein